MRSVEQSLLRTGFGRLDILLIHDCDVWTHGETDVETRFAEAMGGAYKALDRLRSDGTVKAIGVGLNEADMCERFAKAGDFDVMLLAGRYSLLEQPALKSFLPLAAGEAHRHHPGRRVQFRHPGHRRRARRQVQLHRCAAGHHGTGCARSRPCARPMASRSARRRCGSRSCIRPSFRFCSGPKPPRRSAPTWPISAPGCPTRSGRDLKAKGLLAAGAPTP